MRCSRILSAAFAGSYLYVAGAIAAENLVVIPLDGEDTTLSTNASISIPVTSLLHTASFNQDGVLLLDDADAEYFGTSFIIPDDHRPGSLVYVDIHVYNPPGTAVCQADIDWNFGRRYRPGSPKLTSGQFGFDGDFPPFLDDNTTHVHTFRFAKDVVVGDTISFQMLRNGINPADNCGDLHLVGMNIRYTRR